MIKPFDLFEDGQSGLLSGEKIRPMDTFPLQGTPERLHAGVIVTIARPAHTHHYGSLSEHVLVASAAVLASSVSMMQQAWLWMTTLKGHL